MLFTDIVSSTELLSARGDARWRHQLDAHDKLVDRVLMKYGGARVKHTGDGVFALFDGPTKAARCGLELAPALASRGINIRAGIRVGQRERRGDEWSGMAVHIGARIGAMAGPDEVLTTRTVRDLSAGSGLRFESLGLRQLKGLAEERKFSASRREQAFPLSSKAAQHFPRTSASQTEYGFDSRHRLRSDLRRCFPPCSNTGLSNTG